MTNEEALLECSKRVLGTEDEDEVDFFRICMKAIEKQIAKRPVIQYDPPYENPADDEPWYLCPCCMNANIMYPEHHCECGQSLDWSAYKYPEREKEKWKKK